MRSIRAAVLTAIVVSGIVPNVSAAVHGGGQPRFDRERVTRAIAKFLRTFGIVSNADQIIGPRP
jgi:hypothetical protein